MLQYITCTFRMSLLNNYILITDINNLILYFTLSEAISELLVLLLQLPLLRTLSEAISELLVLLLQLPKLQCA